MSDRYLGALRVHGLSTALCLAGCGTSPGEDGNGVGGSHNSSAGGSGGDGAVEVQLGTEFSVQCRNYQPVEDCVGGAVFVRCSFTDWGAAVLDVGTECSRLRALTIEQREGHFTSGENTAFVSSLCSNGESHRDEAPCTVDVEQLVRGEPMSSGGSQSVELGSSVTMKVSCPEGLVHDGGDDVGFVRKRLLPRSYRATATDCELVP